MTLKFAKKLPTLGIHYKAIPDPEPTLPEGLLPDLPDLTRGIDTSVVKTPTHSFGAPEYWYWCLFRYHKRLFTHKSNIIMRFSRGRSSIIGLHHCVRSICHVTDSLEHYPSMFSRGLPITRYDNLFFLIYRIETNQGIVADNRCGKLSKKHTPCSNLFNS